MQIQLDKNMFVPKHFKYLLDYSHRWECYMGSAGSSKSYFITLKLILRASNEKIRILVCRKYGTTLRQTCFSLFKEILGKWNILLYVKINETDMRITFQNESEIIFMGLDDETKLLSLNNIGTIFIEEAWEVPQEVVEQLNLRMRGHITNQQIIMAWNPISMNHWLYDFCEKNPPKSFVYIHSTYKDNPFLSKEYVDALEELYTRNPRKARIFCDGCWGVDDEGLVFTNWEKREFDPFELSKTLEHRTGLDIGFVDPTAIVTSLYDRENKTIYVYDEFYKRGCQLDAIYNQIINMKLDRCKIYCDCADPRAISYLRDKHLGAYPCIKGNGSVEARISFLLNNKIVVLPKCVNFIKELQNFSYIKDNKTGKFIEGKTTHEFSHSIDALGYAFSDIYSKHGLRTINKSVLGL